MAVLYVSSYFFYIFVSQGLDCKDKRLQLRRFVPCAVLAILPAASAGLPLTGPLFLPALLTGLSWIVTYLLLYYITNRKVSRDFGFHSDIAFGLYLIGWFTSLKVLFLSAQFLPDSVVTAFMILSGGLEFLFIWIPSLELAYYAVYGTCVNDDAMIMLRDTNHNEILEYCKMLPKTVVCITGLLLAVLLLTFCHASGTSSRILSLSPLSSGILAVTFLFLTVYLFFGKKPLFPRTGIIHLYLVVQEYIRSTMLYRSSRTAVLQDLKVTPSQPDFSRPSTILLVIGESASRDYMKAFNESYSAETTPWLSSCRKDDHYLFFPNTYSCAHQTVTSLERVLTEFNQYDEETQFYSSASIVDIAHQAGYHVYWYSNQGYLGSTDTPVTLVANTSDVAKWTKQVLNQVQYDEALLENIKEVPPSQHNFVIVHLKGSHAKFENRYPKEFTKFGTPGQNDLISTYENTIAYTDHILQSLHDYAVNHLNLQAMIYFSDHAVIPDKRRTANFDGFGSVRIPLFLWFSEEYKDRHRTIFETLRSHQNKYFTTDLAYELLCGIFDIRSNHFKEENCLASPRFKFTRDMLKTNLGRAWIKDDTNGPQAH